MKLRVYGKYWVAVLVLAEILSFAPYSCVVAEQGRDANAAVLFGLGADAACVFDNPLSCTDSLIAPQAQNLSGFPTVNDTAHFFAGKQLSEESPLKAVRKEGVWRQYAAALDAQWNLLRNKRLGSMGLWAKSELKPRLPKAEALYYMFSGPDFVTAHALFPDIPNYILCGLEPLGRIPDIKSMKADELFAGLQNLTVSLKSIVQLSFFRTLDMQVDFEKGEFHGVLPVLYIFAVRTGHQVSEMSYVSLDEEGKLSFLNDLPDPAAKGVFGIRMLLRHEASQAQAQQLYYFKANLVDAALKKNDAMLKFLGSFGKGVSYLKAASYLMHKTYFSIIRDFLLTHSKALLEDDSGIPYSFFPVDKWNVQLYGAYVGVLDLFKEHYQDTLKQAYAETKNVRPIPFATGYTFNRKSNMLLALAKE